MSLHHKFSVTLPGWVDGFVGHWLNERGAALDTVEHRMQLAVALAAENVKQGDGGPFGAVIVRLDTGQLVGVGVNLVIGARASVAHAEIVALSLAQQGLDAWNLADRGPMQLVTSCEPCAMCFGAVPWSGVRSLAFGARREDAEAAGFDEGDKPENWTATLERRGIEIVRDVMREEAARVLLDYIEAAGTIYNPSRE